MPLTRHPTCRWAVVAALCEVRGVEPSPRAASLWRSWPASWSPLSWPGSHWTRHRAPGHQEGVLQVAADTGVQVAKRPLSHAQPNMVPDVAGHPEACGNHRACSTSLWEARMPGLCLVRGLTITVCLGLRGSQRCGSFNAKIGKVPGKLKWVGHPTGLPEGYMNQLLAAQLESMCCTHTWG